MEYIEQADDRLLRMMQALAESYQEDELPVSHKMELDKRLEKYAQGQTRFYTREEMIQRLK